MTDCEVLRQLDRSGYLPAFIQKELSADGKTLIGTVDVTLVDLLKLDPKFGNGNFYGLHRDVGAALIDFRSHTNAFGEGSLQFVISRATGNCYVDVDKFSPYADLVGFVGHSGEVVTHFFQRIFRRKNHANT